MKRLLLLFIALVTLKLTSGQNESRLMRFPASYDEQIVFTYAGDLYTCTKTNPTARKLTSHVGYEMFAKFSPDGKQIAFTAQYDGNTEVYVMPSQGGIPKRLTYTATLQRDDVSDRMGPNNIVLGWKDNNTIIFRSRDISFNDFKGKLYSVNTNGKELPQQLPLPFGGFCSISPDKSKLAYNRVFREFRTWKYYRGGMADDVWIYDFKSKKTENITKNDAQDIFPMWNKEVIYFLSDRDRTMNLFSYNTSTKETKKLTNFTEFDIKFPSLGTNEIIFENGGFIYTYSLTTQKTEKLSIFIADDALSSRNQWKDASKNINSFSLAPDGNRIIFGARGDLFSVPAKSGITKNLSNTSNAHERNAIWSPNGKYIAYISDISGEDEIYIINQDGLSAPIQLTDNSDSYKYEFLWSPDSKNLLWSDRMQRLQFINIDSKKITLVEQSKDGEFREFCWSPDSKWIAFSRPSNREKQRIFIYSLNNNSSTAITDNWYDSSDPAFSTDGKYLYFISNRDFNPIYSWTEWNHAYQNMSKIYFVSLTSDLKSPLFPTNDEVKIENDNPVKTETKPTEDKANKDSKNVVVNIDFNSISERISVLPIDACQYNGIFPLEDRVYYISKKPFEEKGALYVYIFKDKKETKIAQVNNYEVSANLQKMLVRNENKYFIIDIPKSSTELKDAVDLSDLKVFVDLKQEWQQIYNEAWRQMRDFFYDPNMHGVNWKAMKEKYQVLIPYVNHRNDLSYIIGELIGELNVGHAYVGGGDRPEVPKVKTGLLGAQLTVDASGYYKISKILKGENWTSTTKSPLTEPGLNVKEGEFIIAVNGKSVKNENIYKMLQNTVGKQVEITINSTPNESGARKIIVIPIGDESNLYYYNWVRNNIKKVNEATNGQVGYIHIPDMGVEGLNEFVKYFYPQLSKKALIIDDRGNGGGNVSPMIIERLNRELALMKVSRNSSVSTGPAQILVGPKVCLIDCYSASDGDLFPYQFKKLNIGKVIGERSWGGVVGIRGSLPFIDGGTLSKPEFSHYDAEGKNWIIEGHGVDPDIEVDNDPAKEFDGIDEQLNKAIEIILEELKNYPKELAPAPAYPDKSK